MKIIGITGGVGSGKSVVLTFLEKEYGATIVETDKLAHRLQMPGNNCYDKIVDEFGSEILDINGIINRMKLGAVVFSNESALKKLNEIVHPEVISELKKMISDEENRNVNSHDKIFVIESAILFESKLDELCDETWYIYANEDVRSERLVNSRGYSRAKISSIINSQLNEDDFRKKCTKTIDNSSDIESTYRQIREEFKHGRTI